MALNSHVTLNLDNEHDVDMVSELLRGKCAGSTSKIGLRINPLVAAATATGSGAVSHATRISKFGVPVTNETRSKVAQIYEENPWLTGIHVHVGSQGVPMDLFVKGVRVGA